MCQEFCETVSNIYPLILSTLTFLGLVLVIKFVQGADERKDADSNEPINIQGVHEKIIKDSRYDVKKCSRCNKDVNRWGRWYLMFRNGHKKTVIGMLYNVLDNNPEAYKYKEIQ